MDLIGILEICLFVGIFVTVFGGVWVAMSRGGRDYASRLAAATGRSPRPDAAAGTDLALARIRTARRVGGGAAGRQEADVLVTVLPENGREYEATIRVQLPLNGDATYRPGRMLVVAPATRLHPIAVVPIPPADWAQRAAQRTPAFA